MAGTSGAGKQRSDFVLAAARALYLGVAVISLVVALIALGTAGYYEIRSWIPAKHLKVPDVYRVDKNSIDLGIIDAHFAPPKNIRFSTDLFVVTQTLAGTEILGHFEATTANGLAVPPEDVDVIGGTDAAKFVRVPYSDVSGHSGLQLAPALVSDINQTFGQIKTPQTRSFSIQVIARDRFGNISAPADITIKLYLAPPGTTSESVDPNLTPLEALALDIAQRVDPTHGVKYIEAFKRAKAVPAQCNAVADGDLFVANYRHAFDHVRNQLSAATLPQFYLGVCDGWDDVRAKVTVSREIKAGVQLKNLKAENDATLNSLFAKAMRNYKLIVAGGAFVFFMFISLMLAFLAIENHTRGMREAMENDKPKRPEQD